MGLSFFSNFVFSSKIKNININKSSKQIENPTLKLTTKFLLLFIQVNIIGKLFSLKRLTAILDPEKSMVPLYCYK